MCKRKLIIFLLFLLVISFSVFEAEAEGISEAINSQKSSALDQDTIDKLNDAGLDEISVESITKLDFGKIFSAITDSIISTVKDPIKTLPILISAVLLLNITEISCFSYIKQSKFISSVFKTSVIGAITVGFLTKVMYKAVTALKICNTFSVSLVPIYYIIILASSKPISATAFQNIMIIFCNLFSSVLTYIVVPCISMCCALSFAKSISDSNYLDRFHSVLSTFIKFGITVFMSVFAAVISLKSNISSAADTVTGRLTKTLISSTVPVIGGYISDSMSALKGTVNILKSGVGIYAVVAVIIIILPSFIELLLYSLVFKLADSAVITAQSNKNSILSSLSECLTLLIVTQISAVVMYIFSFSVVLNGV